MTQPESPNPASESQSGSAPASSVQQVQGRGITGRFLAEHASATQGNTAEPKSVADELEVDWGGVQRRFKVSELVERARTAEEAMAQAKALADASRQTVVHNEAVRGFAERVEKLSAEERAELGHFLQNPTQFRRAPKAVAEDDPFLAAAARPQLDAELQSKIARLEEGHETLAKFLTQIGTERQAQTLSQAVDRHMADLNVFKAAAVEHPALVRMSRNHVLMALARDPSQSIERLVHGVALDAQEVMAKTQPRGLASSYRSPSSEPPKPAFSGADLLAGKVKQAAAREMGL